MDFKALVTAKLSANNAEAQLKDLCKDRNVNLKVNLTGDVDFKNIQKQLDSISKQTIKLNTDKSTINEIKSDFQMLKNLANEISQKKIKLVGLDDTKNVNQIKELRKQIGHLESDYKILKQTFNSSLNQKQLGQLEQIFGKTSDKVSEIVAKSKDLKSVTSVISKVDESSSKLKEFEKADTSQFKNASAYQKMTSYIKDAEDAMKRFNAEKEKGENANFSVLTKEMKEVESATKKAETQYKSLYTQINKLDATTASNKALSWLNNNDKVYKDKNLSGTIESIAHQLKEVTLQGEFDSLQKELNDYIAQAQAAGLTGKSWMSGFKQSFGAIAQFTGIYGVLQNVVEEVPRQMVQYVADVDAEMTNLQMATGATDSEAKELMKTYSAMGKELKTLGTDIAASSTEWLKQGKSIQEAQKLTKNSIALSKIGDMSSEDATKTITAAMKSYELAESEVMGFIDQISAIDMASATDIAGLSDAFNEVAANAKVAGVETEKLLSYAAVIGETSQEGMASVGTALNAIFSRMGNIKLSRLKDYENGGEDLSNVETVLKKNSIALRDATGQFREFDDVLAETASRWENFDSVTKRAVGNAFAGTNHQNSFTILMENWNNVEKYIETATNSSGESMKKFAEYQNSLAGSIEGFKNSVQSLSNTAISSDFLGNIVDMGTDAIEVLDWLIDKVGALNTIIGVAGGILTTKSGSGKNVMPFSIRQNKIIAVLLT